MPVYNPKPDLNLTQADDSDFYKRGHYRFNPPGTTRIMSYLTARGGNLKDTVKEACLFGTQYRLHRYLAKPVTKEDVELAAANAARQGSRYNTAGWMRIVEKHGGYMPVRIRAVPEGLMVPTGNALLTIETTDDELPWVGGWLETAELRVWGGSTVATMSHESKKIIAKYLRKTQGDLEGIDFGLHDFGGRGVESQESSMILSAAHLLSFQGSDSDCGVAMANHYYDCNMSAFSIEATEHSNPMLWGRAREFEFVEHAIRSSLYEGQAMLSCVGDTWDIYNFTKQVSTGNLKDLIKGSGGKFVIRPDSGDPLEVLPRVFGILEETLKDEIVVRNGYKMLPSWIGVIQGDGINIKMMERILEQLTRLGWCARNIVFGSGGGLLQWVRDDLGWSFKLCSGLVDGQWTCDPKDPVTSSSKRSQAGRLDLIRTKDGFRTIDLGPDTNAHPDTAMDTVYEVSEQKRFGETGGILRHATLADLRAQLVI